MNSNTCPHSQTKSGRSNRGNVILAVLVGIIVIGLLASSLRSCSSHPTLEPKPTTSAPPTSPATSAGPPPSGEYIPGLTPDMLTSVYKEVGYSVEKNMDAEAGSLWTCTKEENGFAYEVDIFGPNNGNYVRTFSVDIRVAENGASIKNAKGTMQTFAASPLLETPAAAQQARDWIAKNFNAKEATTTIGGIPYQFNAPNRSTRMLAIGRD